MQIYNLKVYKKEHIISNKVFRILLRRYQPLEKNIILRNLKNKRKNKKNKLMILI
jgi:hypothetical protein